MFADSLLDVSWAQRARRSWTTLTSFGLQALVIGLLLLLPLWKTVGLQAVRILPTPLSWGVPEAPAPRLPHQRAATGAESNLADNVVIAPGSIPDHVQMITEDVPPPQLSFNDGIDGGTGNGSRNGVLWSLTNSFRNVAPPPAPAPAPVVRTFRTSSVLAGSLVRRVQPAYPPLAKAARIQGEVVLAAIISKAGTIEELQALSGHPMLVAAAVEAVRQWRYRPYLLNGESVEVETRITVNFTLTGN
jgi:protein TonB